MTPTCTLVILGAAGDLTQRLLLPGIGSLLEREPDRCLRIIGVDRDQISDAEFGDLLVHALTDGGAADEVAQRIAAAAAYVSGDVTVAETFTAIMDVIGEGDGPANTSDRLVFYFALPPVVTVQACSALRGIDLPAGLQLAMEKPFGSDATSARALNAELSTLVPDSQVHRVDHFLGKSTVLDIIALRFSNRLFQEIWSAEHIESIEIAYDETLALEGRAGYYDRAGALQDMIQSHLLQVLALVAMEQPASITERDLRDAKAAALRATRLWGGTPASASKRARYTAGEVDGRSVPNYVDEDGVDPERNTETLAALTVEVANNRWAGVPITLRSGKALGVTRKHVAITFKQVHHLPVGLTGAGPKDQLIIGLNPDVMELRITTNGTDDPLHLEQSIFRTTLRESELEAYGEVLAGILDGEALLTVRGDTAVECWRICDGVIAAWQQGAVPMEEYAAGSNLPDDWESALG